MAACVQTAWQASAAASSVIRKTTERLTSSWFSVILYLHLSSYIRMFGCSDVRIYLISDGFESGITPKKHPMSKNLGLLGKARQDELLQFHLNL